MVAQTVTMLVQGQTEHSWRERLAIPIMAAGAVMTLPWIGILLAVAWQLGFTLSGLVAS